jgi:hypothetical protein
MRILAPTLALWLAGCPSVGPAEWDSVRDQDGDGSLSERFGGPDCFDDDPAILVCDGDHDGHRALAAGGDDCDDEDASVVRRTWFRDLDGDSFGDPDATVDVCEAGALLVDNALDCDDADPDVKPGVREECDDVDRNCDGHPTAGAPGTYFWLDQDGDGHGGSVRSDVGRCEPGPGEAEADDDCDDARDDVYPGAPGERWYDGIDTDCSGGSDWDRDGDGQDSRDEIGGPDCDDRAPEVYADAPELCDGIDNDCDGLVDDDDREADQVGQVEYFRDGDQDGFGSDTSRFWCPGAAPPEFTLLGGDCDDRNATVRPGAAERCNGADDDCNSAIDDNPSDGPLGYVDDDGDGWGLTLVAGRYCGAMPDGVAPRDGDCDDTLATRFPGAPEVCGDSVRQDCDPGPADDCDLDGDPDASDCADADPAVHAGVPEICNGVDDDCDTLVDAADPSVDPSTERLWYLDLDGDGFGSAALASSCSPPPGAADNGLDCDDTDDARSPGADERCNGLDDDCDAVVDEEPADAPTWWLDADADGFGDPAMPLTGACANPDPTRWVPVAGDCAPLDPAVAPGAAELCDGGLDNDCDGLVDDDDTEVAGGVWFEDADGDGYGLDSDRVVACGAVAGRTLAPGDCDDGDGQVHPGAVEVCNAGVDDDCDGDADGDDASVGATTFWVDADGDGFGDGTDPGLLACSAPAGSVPNPSDCDDTRASVSPAAVEVCDAADRDEDCDGLSDDADPSTVNRPLAWIDLDLDGYPGTPTLDCDAPPPPASVDCNDANPSVNPGLSPAADVCNGLDDDCDGTTDFRVDALVDADGDGFGVGGAVQVGCAALAGYVPLQAPPEPVDCDDTSLLRRPDFPYEICTDGVDNDCDGAVDAADPNALGCAGTGGGGGGGSGPEVHLYWPDLDRDGLGDWLATPELAPSAPADRVANALDCDDTLADVIPAPLTSAAAVEAVFAAPTALACQAIVLDPTLYTQVGIDTPNNVAPAKVYLVGPLDGATARPAWEGATVRVDDADSIVGIAGVDFVPFGFPNGDWPVRVSNGVLGVSDVVLEDGGLRHTGGDVSATLVTVSSPPVNDAAADPSAWKVTLSNDQHEHTARFLRVEDAPGDAAIRVDTGTFEDVSVARSAPFVVAPAAMLGSIRDVELRRLTVGDCTSDCVTLDAGSMRNVSLRNSTVSLAAERGVVATDSGLVAVTLDHVTVVASGTVGVDSFGADLHRCIVWGSGDQDVSGSTVNFTGTLYATSNALLPTVTQAPPAGTVPGFQSFGGRLPWERWDLHLSPVDPNGGWSFRLGDLGAFPRTTDAWYTDADADGLPDGWELTYLGALAPDGTQDADADGLPDADEYLDGTWPSIPDTDGDGTDDGLDAAPLDGAVR